LVAVRGWHIFGMVLVFMFNVILPEYRKQVYYGRVGSQPQLASLQVHAQQCVHLTLGSRRVLEAFSLPQPVSHRTAFRRPPQRR